MEWEAKQAARQRHKTIEFWYRRKYSLPVTDERFLDATVEEMLTDYWSHTYYDDPKALEEIEDEDFDIDSVAEQIGAAPPDDWEDMT